MIKFCRFLPAWSELQTQTCAQGALYQLPGRLLPFRTQMHRCTSKVWTAWPRRHGPENGQKGRFQSHHRNCCYFPHPRLWLHATTVEKSGTKFLTATKCPRFHFFCLGCLTFLLRSSKLCNTLSLLQELKDQQVNELGKTFMPYTQSNYRMHPMVVMPTKNGEFTVIRRATADLIVSRLWTRSPASSVAKMATLPTNVPRYSEKIPCGGFSLWFAGSPRLSE